MPTAANSALSNQLSAKATDLLNRDYGYTAAEQQAFRDSAMSQFNRTQDEDLRRLEALYEQYGLNSGAGELGGQAGSSLQDYFGKRAQAQADIETGLQTYFAQKKSGDEQAAIQTATAIQNQIYNQVRGDYQDMLSYLQVNETIDNNAFQRAMSLAGFQSEEAQRDFLNQLGISDRESQDYWMGVETAFNQQMQGAEFNAAQIQQQFTNQMTAAGFDAQQSQWLFQNQATLAELASQMTQQEFENTMTAAGFTAQQAQAAFNNSMNVNTTNFEQQVTSQNLADQGLQMLQQMVQQGTISASDYMNLVAALTQGEQKQFTTAMNNDQNQMSNLLLPLTLMMNLLSQNANTGVNVNVNGGTPGNGIAEDSVKNWLKDKLGISDKEEGYFDEFYRWIPGKKPNDAPPTPPGDNTPPQDEESPGPEVPLVPGPIKTLGHAIAAYGLYRIGKDTLTGWFGKDQLTETEAPYVAWSYLNKGDVNTAINKLALLDPLEREFAFAALKEGLFRVGNQTLAPITLDANMEAKFNQKGWLTQWKGASSERANTLTAQMPTENSSPADQLNYMEAMVWEGMFPDKFTSIVPAMSEKEYKQRAADFVKEGKWTQDMYNKAIADLQGMKEAWG
jgi:hypothetical protein